MSANINNNLRMYSVVLEWSGRNWSAYLPDVPGCFAAGDSKAETLELLREALTMHFEGMRQDGLAIPEPSSKVAQIVVAVSRQPKVPVAV